MKAKKSHENRFIGAFLLHPARLRGQMDAAKVMSHVLKLKFWLGNNCIFKKTKIEHVKMFILLFFFFLLES